MRLENLHEGVYDYSDNNFDVVYRPGVQHQAPDALLRLEADGLEESPVYNDILVLALI